MTTIVVPCYNEEKRLDEGAFLAYARAQQDTRFLFVNDGSTDGTAQVLDRLCRENPERLDALHLPHNSGKAEAVRRGVLHALDLGSRYVGYWDADLATPLEEIAHFSRVLDRRPDIDLVMGARVQLLGRSIQRKALRHYLGRACATAVSLALHLETYDTQCGAKLLRDTSEIRQVFEAPFIAGWIFDVEIIARMIAFRRRKGLPDVSRAIVEWPVETWNDVAGSKIKLRDYAVAAWNLGRIRRRYLR
ncbi:family 2 glycosyl transferase [Acidobacteria bacterium Mor1]|nr:family 2 glycosyl transferase [Acidobacteria bacterium Mor1]